MMRRTTLATLSLLALALALAVTGAVVGLEATPTHANRAPTPAVRAAAAPGAASLARGDLNVLVITVDDMREDDLRFMPNTRNLLAARGVRFENAFANFPLCCPARASFLTGLYAHNHHVWSHEAPYGFQSLDDRETIPVWMRRRGYDTLFLGKYLNGYGTQRPPDGSASNSTRYVPPGWTDWKGAIDGGLGAGNPLDGGTYRFFNTTLNDNGRRFYLRKDTYQSDVFGSLVQQQITRYSGDDKPFFFWVNYVAPHHGSPDEPDDPRAIRRSDGEYTRLVTTARPERVKGDFDGVIKRAPGAAGEATVNDKPAFIRRLPQLNDPERRGLVEVTRQRAEALKTVDEQIPGTLRALTRTGELSKTLIMFTSDNGYFLGEHRMRQGKILPYEPSLAVPLIMRGPGIPWREARSDPFLTVDFAPTILQAAQASVAQVQNGQGMLTVAQDGDQGWRRGVLTETAPGGTLREADESGPPLRLRGRVAGSRVLNPAYSQGLRTDRFLYVEHASGERELYDMRADPRQDTNVVDTARYRHFRTELAAHLDRIRNCRTTCRAWLPKDLRSGP